MNDTTYSDPQQELLCRKIVELVHLYEIGNRLGLILSTPPECEFSYRRHEGMYFDRFPIRRDRAHQNFTVAIKLGILQINLVLGYPFARYSGNNWNIYTQIPEPLQYLFQEKGIVQTGNAGKFYTRVAQNSPPCTSTKKIYRL